MKLHGVKLMKRSGPGRDPGRDPGRPCSWMRTNRGNRGTAHEVGKDQERENLADSPEGVLQGGAKSQGCHVR